MIVNTMHCALLTVKTLYLGVDGFTVFMRQVVLMC